MKHFVVALIFTAYFSISSCASVQKFSSNLTPQEVEELMQRGSVAEIFAGHEKITVTLDSGEIYTARLPSPEIIQAYMEYRNRIGKPVIYEME